MTAALFIGGTSGRDLAHGVRGNDGARDCARYARVGAAMLLAEGGSRDQLVVAILLRAGLIDEEEDVRKAALDALSALHPSLAI